MTLKFVVTRFVFCRRTSATNISVQDERQLRGSYRNVEVSHVALTAVYKCTNMHCSAYMGFLTAVFRRAQLGQCGTFVTGSIRHLPSKILIADVNGIMPLTKITRAGKQETVQKCGTVKSCCVDLFSLLSLTATLHKGQRAKGYKDFKKSLITSLHMSPLSLHIAQFSSIQVLSPMLACSVWLNKGFSDPAKYQNEKDKKIPAH